MRSFKSALFTFAIAGFAGMVAVIGCSADGTTDAIDESGTEPSDEGGNQLPPSNPTTSSSGSTSKDAGKDSAPKTDAGKDAGPPPPKEGDPCTVKDTVYTEACGKCGKSQAICLDSGGGVLKVSPYGACLGETGVCEPGTTQQAACGNCGTLTQTCNNYCAWTSSQCTGQPTNSCAPNTTEYTTAGCAVNLYRNRTCDTTCVWSGFSTSCAAPNNANKLNIATTVNGNATGSYSLKSTQVSKRQPLYGCGASASLSTTTDHPYEIIELTNTTAKTATVSVTGTGTPVIESTIAAYPNALPPTDDNSLKACTTVDWGYSTAYPDITGITIAAGAKILIRVQAYYDVAQTTYPCTGNFGLQVTTTALN
jgi:hypothetical protein